jgi:hypothetical protein
LKQNTKKGNLAQNSSLYDRKQSFCLVNVKQNTNVAKSKVANIKHVNSANSLKSFNNYQNVTYNDHPISNNAGPSTTTTTNATNNNNGKQITTYYSLSSLNQAKTTTTTTTSTTTITTTAQQFTKSKSLLTAAYKQLNVNDLYAILTPVITPHVHKPSLKIINKHININNNINSNNQYANLSINLVYLGSIYVPYDTLSNSNKVRTHTYKK